jgi:hypothetical protein
MSAAVSEPIDDSRWDALRREVAELEQYLVRLTQCMQRERECVTLFDIGGLTQTVREKQRVLAALEVGEGRRTEIFEAAWTEAALELEMPGEVPGVLEAMADSPECRGIKGWLLDAASELLALMDVVAELQSLNRAMVGRALQWVNAYVAELSGGSGTYNAKGRVVNRARNTLVRSV